MSSSSRSQVTGEMPESDSPGPVPTKRPGRGLLTRAFPYLLALPALSVVAVILLYPLVRTIFTSFWDWDFLRPGDREFIGFDNYAHLLTRDTTFRTAARFTAVFTVGSIILELLVSFSVALLLDGMRRARGTVATIAILPFMLASIAVGYMWRLMLARNIGLVNYVLSWFGIEQINWLAESQPALFAMIISEAWQAGPFTMLILLAGLQGIPEELIESSATDGANPWQVFRHIKIPLLMPAIAVALIFQSIFKLRVFDLAVALTGGGPGIDTTPVGLLISRQFLQYFDIGRASAMSVILLFVGAAVAMVYIRFLYKEES